MSSQLPRLITRVSLARKHRVRAAAKAAGLRLSDWLRRAIGRELARERKKVTPPSSSGSPTSNSDVVDKTHD